MRAILLSMFFLLSLALGITPSHADSALRKNGFDLSDALIPVNDIHSGGPPKDGIPAIDSPKFIRPKFLKLDSSNDNDRVLGIVRNGISKAYPVSILNWHEIVNDRFGTETVIVSYCPLCGTGMAFALNELQQHRRFGVSGLLYNSDVLLYDRQTGSLWSQLLAKAISGPFKGTQLNAIPISHTTWKDWKSRHPDTLLLSTNTGFNRDYDRDPYAGYANSEGIYFPVSHKDPRYHPKERVIGIEINGHFKAYPFSELSQTTGEINDFFGGKKLQIIFDGKNETANAYNEQGREIPGTIAFWFAWVAFHPDTEVFRP